MTADLEKKSSLIVFYPSLKTSSRAKPLIWSEFDLYKKKWACRRNIFFRKIRFDTEARGNSEIAYSFYLNVE